MWHCYFEADRREVFEVTVGLLKPCDGSSQLFAALQCWIRIKRPNTIVADVVCCLIVLHVRVVSCFHLGKSNIKMNVQYRTLKNYKIKSRNKKTIFIIKTTKTSTSHRPWLRLCVGWVSASRSVCFRCPFVLLLTSNWKNAHAPKATFSFPYELSEQIQMVKMLQNLMRVMPVEHNGRLSGLIVSISHRWTPDRVRKIKSGLSLLAKCGKHQENTQGNMCCCSDLEGRIQVGVWRLCHNLRMMWKKSNQSCTTTGHI